MGYDANVCHLVKTNDKKFYAWKGKNKDKEVQTPSLFSP